MKKNQSQAGNGDSKKGTGNQGKGASAVERKTSPVEAARKFGDRSNCTRLSVVMGTKAMEPRIPMGAVLVLDETRAPRKGEAVYVEVKGIGGFVTWCSYYGAKECGFVLPGEQGQCVLRGRREDFGVVMPMDSWQPARDEADAKAESDAAWKAHNDLDTHITRAAGLLTLLSEKHAQTAIDYNFAPMAKTQAESLEFLAWDVAEGLEQSGKRAWETVQTVCPRHPQAA
jgi:hypothetical protein